MDLNVKPLTLAHIQWADVVFISALHVQRTSLQREGRLLGLDHTGNNTLPRCYQVGILDHSRSEFWRYMQRVFLAQRDKLGQAIVPAAMGYHFRRLTDEY